jgi:pimeloyl-ACP methyl ester carboxylesterase
MRPGKEGVADYVKLGEVRTWYDEHGHGEPLVMLHPGGADARAFAPNLDALAKRFHVYTPERRGHGRTPDVAGPFTFDLVAGDTIAFIERVIGRPAHLVGCSDGASVAFVVARRRPDLVERVVAVAGPFHRDGWLPAAIDPIRPAPEFMVASYAEISPDGRDHHPVIHAKLNSMHAEGPSLTTDDLARIGARTLVMVADDDEVTIEHAVAAYRGIPDCELAVVPGTSHGLLVEKPELCNAMIVDFLANEPVETLAPVRRP